MVFPYWFLVSRKQVHDYGTSIPQVSDIRLTIYILPNQTMLTNAGGWHTRNKVRNKLNFVKSHTPAFAGVFSFKKVTRKFGCFPLFYMLLHIPCTTTRDMFRRITKG
jgi:hypothetical protein